MKFDPSEIAAALRAAARALSGAVPEPSGNFVPWDNMDNLVCVPCGAVVPEDRRASHEEFHRQAGTATQPPKPAQSCSAHTLKECVVCAMNPSTCAAERVEEPVSSCDSYLINGFHWHACPNRVVSIDSVGRWYMLNGTSINPAAADFAEQRDALKAASREAAERQQKWHHQLSEILGYDHAVSFESMINYVSAVVRERDRLRNLEDACVRAGASGSTPETIGWIETLVADRTGMFERSMVLAEAFVSLRQTMGRNHRDWNADGLDAWLYGLFVGWDCEEDHEHTEGVCNVLDEVAQKWGFPTGRLARVREYRWVIRHVQQLIEKPAAAVDKAAVTATLTDGFDDEVQCRSLYLANGKLFQCGGTTSHAQHGHPEYTNWSDAEAVPVPWPLDQEPPDGIDVLRDTVTDANERNVLRRHPGVREWGWYESMTDAIDPDRRITWEQAVSDVNGDLVVVYG